MINIGLVGATGKMGYEIIKYLNTSEKYNLLAAVSSKNNINIGKKLSDIFCDCISSVILEKDIEAAMSDVDVIIDVTNADAIKDNIYIYKKLKKPLIIGSTNISLDTKREIEELSKYVAVCISSNFSILFNHLVKLLSIGLPVLPHDLDAYIIELHSKSKKDKPSGTALLLSEIMNKAMRFDNENIQSIRAGSSAGYHEIGFVNDFNEKIVISYSSGSRVSYVTGIIFACEAIVHLDAGYYSFDELLFQKHADD